MPSEEASQTCDPGEMVFLQLIFSPNHPIHYSTIGLYDLHNLAADILIRVIRNRYAIITVPGHFYCRIDRLQHLLGRLCRPR
jgi:hypothetical protein